MRWNQGMLVLFVARTMMMKRWCRGTLVSCPFRSAPRALDACWIWLASFLVNVQKSDTFALVA